MVATGPRVAQIHPKARLEDRCQAFPEPIEGGTERSAPLLVPGMAARVATAIAAPALYPMNAAPGAIFDDLDEVFVGVFFHVLAVVG